MNIGLFTSVYFNNIGNGFIDLGCEAQLISAQITNKHIIKLSQCANFAASKGDFFLIKEIPGINWLWVRIMQRFANKLHDHAYDIVKPSNVLSPVKIAKLDYFVIPGCVLTVSFFTSFGKLLEEKTKQGCKLIFWAVSGNHYTENEIKIVSEWLNKIHPYAICTRDRRAFEYYNSFSENVYNGIDNVFFVNRLDLPKNDTFLNPYIVLNFDEPKHFNQKKNLINQFKKYNIVYTDHKPTPYSKICRLSKKGIICSDYPLDYLFMYRNAKETHTDRVHACIPTLSFGNKAQLYSDSPRIALFENIGLDVEEMKRKPISLNLDDLKDMQDKQIEFLTSILI